MSQHVPLFQFQLAGGHTIGPAPLRRLWAQACGTDDVSIGRESRRIADGATSYRYTLCGSPRTFGLDAVELQLRDLLQAHSHGSAVVTRLTA